MTFIAQPQQQIAEGELLPKLSLFYVHQFCGDIVSKPIPIVPIPRGWIEIYAKNEEDAREQYLKIPAFGFYATDYVSAYPTDLVSPSPTELMKAKP